MTLQVMKTFCSCLQKTSWNQTHIQQVWRDFKPQSNISSPSLVSLFSDPWLPR